MKALVTGATGLVGRPFVQRLAADGWSVVISTRSAAAAARLIAPNVRAYHGDLADAESLRPIVEKERRFDVVFHLGASLAYFGKRRDLLAANVTATQNVLDVAVRTGAQRFVYASSIEAVGTITSAQVPAGSDVRMRPVSTYGESKVLAEALVRSAGAAHFPTAVLRIGNVYAEYHNSFIIEIALSILLRNRLLEFLPVYADHCIQPVHNDDVTAGLLLAASAPPRQTTVAIAGRHVTVGELFQRCADVLGRRLPQRRATISDRVFLNLRRRHLRGRGSFDFITYLMAGSGRRVHRALSLESAKRDIGYEPSVPLARGIRESIEWHRQPGQVIHAVENA